MAMDEQRSDSKDDLVSHSKKKKKKWEKTFDVEVVFRIIKYPHGHINCRLLD